MRLIGFRPITNPVIVFAGHSSLRRVTLRVNYYQANCTCLDLQLFSLCRVVSQYLYKL